MNGFVKENIEWLGIDKNECVIYGVMHNGARDVSNEQKMSNRYELCKLNVITGRFVNCGCCDLWCQELYSDSTRFEFFMSSDSKTFLILPNQLAHVIYHEIVKHHLVLFNVEDGTTKTFVNAGYEKNGKNVKIFHMPKFGWTLLIGNNNNKQELTLVHIRLNSGDPVGYVDYSEIFRFNMDSSDARHVTTLNDTMYTVFRREGNFLKSKIFDLNSEIEKISYIDDPELVARYETLANFDSDVALFSNAKDDIFAAFLFPGFKTVTVKVYRLNGSSGRWESTDKSVSCVIPAFIWNFWERRSFSVFSCSFFNAFNIDFSYRIRPLISIEFLPEYHSSLHVASLNSYCCSVGWSHEESDYMKKLDFPVHMARACFGPKWTILKSFFEISETDENSENANSSVPLMELEE